MILNCTYDKNSKWVRTRKKAIMSCMKGIILATISKVRETTKKTSARLAAAQFSSRLDTS
jgi:hypothetical protein